MKFFSVVFALLFGGLQIGQELDSDNNQECITAKMVTRVAAEWKITKTELKVKAKQKFLELTTHNPLNKKDLDTVDAQFLFRIDSTLPYDTTKYTLVAATYYYSNFIIVFKRTTASHEVIFKNKTQRFLMQTLCFTRKIIPIIELEPLIIERNKK